MDEYGITPDDKIVLVIGPAGIGKTTFIDYVIYGHAISHDSRTSTNGIAVRKKRFGTPSQSFAFVDTPGFDDEEGVGDVLWFIWQALEGGFQLDRTLYLHPVFEDSTLPSTAEKLDLAEALAEARLGSIKFPTATFVEMTWSSKREETGWQQVQDRLKYRGYQSVQFRNSMGSARRIILPSAMDAYGITPNDKIILIIGLVGVGKTTFIKYAMGDEAIPSDLNTSTSGITVVKAQLGTPPQSFAFIDTPGFDDGDNVANILWFIIEVYNRGYKLDRTLYLHPALDDPESPSPVKTLDLVESLAEARFGGIKFPTVTFVEMMWSSKRINTGWQLVYDKLKDRGWDPVQFVDSTNSAHRIVLSLEESLNKMDDITQQDNIIIVMGPSQAGKSTFIDYATDGHSLRSSTQGITVRKTIIRGRHFAFVDTPGFNDTSKSDFEILGEIAEFLIVVHQRGYQLNKILYLHRISDNRMLGTPLRNLQLFASLCGNIAMPSVIIVTTMWSLVLKEVGETRLGELCATFWRQMNEGGCDIMEFKDNRASAREIVFRQMRNPNTTLLTDEIVEKHKKLNETEAGIILGKQLEKLVKEGREADKRLAQIRKQQNKPAAKKELESEQIALQDSILRSSSDLRKLSRSFLGVIRRPFHKSQVPSVEGPPGDLGQYTQ